MPPLPDAPAEAAPPAPDAAAPAPSAASRLRGYLVPLGVLGGLAVLGVCLGLFVLRPLFPPALPGASGAPAKPAAREKFGRVVALEPVVVNLAQSEGRRYLKATVHLEVAEEERVVKEVESRKPQLADLLVSTLTKKTLAEVTAPEALDRLRAEIQERARQELGPERIHRVFITEFVVQ